MQIIPRERKGVEGEAGGGALPNEYGLMEEYTTHLFYPES